MIPRFSFPWMLLLLLIVPWSVWIGASVRSLSPGRKWTAIFLRVLILLCLICALAGMELVKENDKLAVFFLLDQSDSLPENARMAAAQAVRNTCDEFMTDKDEAGVIVVGEEASIELGMGSTLELEDIKSFVGGQQTDLASGIRLAMAAFPQGYMKRIVMFTDGNETRGSALEEAKLAQAAGVEVNVAPLKLTGRNEIRLREVSMPNRVNSDEPFQLRIVAQAEQESEATLKVYQRLKSGKRLLKPQKVVLHKGDNTFVLTQELNTSGFYEYEAVIESSNDTVAANNEGRAFTVIQGEPTVLYVEADPKHSSYLGPALISEGVRVVRTDIGGMPETLAQLQNYDAVILSNVSSTDLSSGQLRALEAMVRDLGIGLVMIGGPDSFGAGGYFDTPPERALPVNMDIKQRKILPKGALVCIMHTCEFANGNAWAYKIAVAALNVLSAQDLMGALGYMWSGGGDTWIFKLQPVGDKSYMQGTLKQASGTIGDMMSVGPTLNQAYLALKDCDAAVKRVIIISDGDPAPPSGLLLSKLVSAKIAVSTICINPHGLNCESMLKGIAQKTGGNYYLVKDPNRLPQIFTKEAAVVKRGLLVEKPFFPKPNHDSELLLGLGDTPFPMLRGYVVTMPKDNATVPLVSHEGDPVLAHWRFGLGKAVAFTSDVTTRWAGDWVTWEGFNRFWSQTVRWAGRETSSTSFRVETRNRDGKGYIKIDAVDDEGKFVNFLRPEGAVTGPDFERIELDLMQTGPGIYEGTFPLDDKGVYMINLSHENEDGSRGMITTGLALGYSREYEYNTTNLPLLEQVASVGGGRIMEMGESPFEHNLTATPTITQVWHILVVIAACIFPLEIFVRRVVISFGFVYVAIAAVLRLIPLVKRIVPSPARKERPITGVYGAAPSPDRRFGGETGTIADSFAMPVDDESLTPAQQVEAGPEPGPAHSEYTQQLLAAKKRALGRKGRRGGPTENKEE
ncbi:glutamine amidotransferase [Candidatus Hydrogenedentota bacterium]